MYRIRRQLFLTALVAAALLTGACATSSGSSQQTMSYAGTGFSNFLVIGVGKDFENRVMFERKLVSELRALDAEATALYLVAGGNKPIERSVVEKLVEENDYDAVLITRVLDRDSDASIKAGASGAKAVRKDGRPIDLFRYDYEELNDPPSLDLSLTVRLSTDLFSVESSEMVWAIESEVSGEEGYSSVILESVETIIRQMKKEELVGN